MSKIDIKEIAIEYVTNKYGDSEHFDVYVKMYRDIYNLISQTSPYDLKGIAIGEFDINGKLIHLGDIVNKRCVSGYGYDVIGEVVFENGAYFIKEGLNMCNFNKFEQWDNGYASGVAEYEFEIIPQHIE